MSKFLPSGGLKWVAPKETDSNRYNSNSMINTNTSALFKKTGYNTKYTKTEKKIHNVTGLITNTALNSKATYNEKKYLISLIWLQKLPSMQKLQMLKA